MGRWIILPVLLVVSLGAEPFVYGNSGSTDRQIKRNKTAIYKLRQETARLREEIEGLRSIIEGLNQTVGRLRRQKGPGSHSDKVLMEISTLVDKINQNYVSKSVLKRALKSGKVRVAPQPSKIAKSNTSKQPVAQATLKNAALAKAPSKALYSRGVRLVGKKRYTDAKKRFAILAKRGYKKAATHFYLGEIAYRTRHYTDAVEEYKQSAELNENADYMDTLLLHTGMSLEKGGDRNQAKRFFQAIVDGYPNTASAAVAKKHL